MTCIAELFGDSFCFSTFTVFSFGVSMLKIVPESDLDAAIGFFSPELVVCLKLFLLSLYFSACSIALKDLIDYCNSYQKYRNIEKVQR